MKMRSIFEWAVALRTLVVIRNVVQRAFSWAMQKLADKGIYKRLEREAKSNHMASAAHIGFRDPNLAPC